MNEQTTERLDALSPEQKRALLARLTTTPRQKPQTAPLSLAQERVWALCQLNPDSPAYHITTAYHLRGPLDPTHLARAFNRLIARHAILRTAFTTSTGQPCQLIAPTATLHLAHHDLTDQPPEAQEALVHQLTLAQDRLPFNLAQPPLLRAALLRMDSDTHILILTTHRLVFDGQNWPVLITELSAAYQPADAGSSLPDLPLQYGDFAAWQRATLHEAALATQLDYWRSQLQGTVPLLALPLDHPRGPAQTRAASHSVSIPANLTAALTALSREAGVSLFVTLLAALQVLLHHRCAQDDFVVFTSVAGRNRPELKGLLGLFANLLALRTPLSADLTFRALLERTRVTVADAYAYQDVPVEQVLEQAQLARAAYTSIFQVLLVFWPTPLPPPSWPGLTLTPLEVETKPADFDLLLHLTHTGTSLSGMLRYKADLFTAATIATLLNQYTQLLAAVVADPARPLAALAPALLIAAQGPVTGALPILPSQWAYLRRPNQWINMVEVVTLAQPPDPAHMAAALTHLLAHHDALRTRLTYDGQWHQHLLPAGGPPPLTVVDLTPEPPAQRTAAISAYLSALQPQLGPLTERLFEVTLFTQEPEQPSYLVLTIHHVIGDNASLPLLLTDLHTAYTQLARGEAVRLPPKTTDVATWARQLETYLHSAAFQTQLAAERALLLPPGAPLPVDYPYGRAHNTQETSADVLATLDADATTVLLKAFPKAHQVWLRDILLAGLAQALTIWSGSDRVTVQLVDNGRHLVLPEQETSDLTRTAGCLFVPSLLTLARPTTNDPLAALQALRAQLSRYPTAGIAAGIAQACGLDPEVPAAEVRLNYLGQVAAPSLAGWTPYTGSALSDVVASRRHGGIDRAPVLLNCTAIIIDGQLETRWEYSTRLHTPATVAALAQDFVAALAALAQAELARQAQSAPDGTAAERAYVAPRSPDEAVLAEIWAQALGYPQVGVYDNFFELGGDSITGLRIIAKANQAGLPLTPKLLSERQTIAAILAPSETPGEQPALVQAEQGPVIGPVPLTPIQQWRIERTATPHHWNEATLFEVDQALNPALLEQAITHLVAHHDGLRSRFVYEHGEWHQFIAAPDESVRIERIDLSDLPQHEQGAALEREATRMQTTLDLAHGPLIRVGLFHLGAQRPGRLLIIIHHLLVEGYSLEILMADLWQTYMQLTMGQPVALPPKTTSIRQWATHMVDYVHSEQARQDLDYWLVRSKLAVPPLPRDFGGANTHNTKAWIEFTLSAAETQALQRSRAARAANTITVILAALACAFTEWSGSPISQIDLLQQNRTALLDGFDLSRTVGWFDTIVPVRLDIAAASSPTEALAVVTEQFGQIPNQGVGYGLLRYLSRDPSVREQIRAIPESEATFNYLGMLEHVPELLSLVRPVSEPIGPLYDPQDTRDYPFYIKALIIEEQLHFSWEYSENIHRRETVAAVVEGFVAALRSMIAGA